MNLLLEGPDLQKLLMQAAAAGGAQTRIIRAEKVRKGGVYGFFTRELFAVAIEVPDAPAAEPATDPVPDAISTPVPVPVLPMVVSSPAVPANLHGLAERANAAEQASARIVALQARYQGFQPEPALAAVAVAMLGQPMR